MLLQKIWEREKERERVRVKEMRGCEKKRLSLGLIIWYLWVAICNRERFVTTWFWFWFCGLVTCSRLVRCNFWICFVALSLVSAQLVFGIWYSYLVFVNLWFLGLYLVLWFCICERELFECIWDLGLWEYLYTNLYYLKFVIVKFIRRHLWM